MTRKQRKTRHGLPVAPVIAPVDPANTTPYGALRLRKPIHKDEFAGSKGSPIPAGVLDIDGTLQDFGSSASKKVLDWMDKVQKRYPDMVWLVITARTHEYDYIRSFNWLVKHVPYAFIGPFHRAADDPRYASEFKREIAQGFEDMGLYRIVAAADDNRYVIDMWKHWGQTHFADPAEFDLLEASYSGYADWRKSLPATKGYTAPKWTSPPVKSYTTSTGKSYTSRYAPVGGDGWDSYDRWEDNDDDYLQGALARLDAAKPSEQAVRIENRLDLEDDVIASYPDLSYPEVEALDTVVLRQMLADRPNEVA